MARIKRFFKGIPERRRRFVRWTYSVIEIEGVILLVMLLIAIVGTGSVWLFTDFFGEKESVVGSTYDDE